MSRILFLANHDIVICNFRYEIIERLLREGHEVYISCPKGDRIGALINIGAKHCDVNIDRHGLNPFKDLKLIRYYKKIIKTIEPNVVFSFTIKPNIYGALACKKTKTPIVPNITGLGSAIKNGGFTEKIVKVLYKKSFKNISKIFFQNEDNLAYFVNNKLFKCPYELLPGSGVNLERFYYSTLPDSFNFLFAARIIKEKGIEEYLTAAKSIKQLYPETSFSICGECNEEYKNTIQEYVDENIVSYFGSIKDLRPYYLSSSCVVLPSFHEGMSNTLLEASAMGRPTIASNIPGCKEIIEDCVSGFLCLPNDSNDLKNKMLKFLSLTFDERNNMGKSARLRMEKLFDRNIVINKYLEALNQYEK